MATAAATLLFAMVIAGVLLWQVRNGTFAALDRETQQRELADQRLRQSEANYSRALQAVDMVIEQIGSDEYARVTGMMAVRRELFANSLEFYDAIIDNHANDPQALHRKASAYARVQSIHGLIGDRDKARAALEEEFKIWQRLLKDEPDNAKFKLGLAKAIQNRGWNLPWQNKGDRIELFEQSIALRHEVLDQLTDPAAVVKVRENLAVAYHSVAFHSRVAREGRTVRQESH